MLICRGKVHNATNLQHQFYPELSARTVQRELCHASLRIHVLHKVPFFTHWHRQAQLVFTHHIWKWGTREWKVIVFFNETKLNLLSSASHDYVRRKLGEAYRDNNTIKTKKYGSESLMLWGCIILCGVECLHHIDRIIDLQKYIEILAESFLETLANHRMNMGHVILQQNDNSKHALKQIQ